jgi:hypothetical protein
MAYCYVLDIEISEGKHQEANQIVRKIAELFRDKGANLEVFAPVTGNVHKIFAIFRFETLSEYEELIERAGTVEELIQLEHQFHDLMKLPVYNLYSKIC